MSKKVCTLIMAVAVFGITVVGCTEETSAAIWTAPSTVKYMLEQSPDYSYGNTLKIEMAQNEYESAQLIVTPETNIKSYDVTVSDLRDDEGNTISSSSIDVYAEKYIEVKTVTTSFASGFYPDAIVPLELVQQAGEDLIKSGQNQAFLITVKTESDTPAGTYEGTVTLKLNNTERKIDVCVTVYDFSISSSSHMQTSFGLWTDFFSYVTENASDETLDNYIKTLLKYRVSTIPGRIGSFSEEEMIGYYAKWLSLPECSHLEIPYTTVNATSPSGKSYYSFDVEYMRKFLTGIIKASTDDNNLIGKLSLSFSTYDEPKASQYEYVCLVSEAFQNLKNELAEDITLFAPGVKDAVKESLKKIPCVTTTHYSDALARDYENGDYYGVDTWCGKYDYYDSALNRYYLQKQIEKGDGSWWYGCISPTNPYPSYHIDDNLLSARLINWMMMDYGITGNLYWCTNLWATYDGSYTYRDVWTEALAFPGANGDGYLIYPGDRYGINDAIASLRLEAVRDGMEDYEYLYVLKGLSEKLAAEYSVKDYDFNESIRDIYRILYSGTVSLNDANAFSMAKNQIMQMIVAAKKGVLLDCAANYASGKVEVNVYTGSSAKSVSIDGINAAPRISGSGKMYSASVFSDGFINVSVSSEADSTVISRYAGGVAATLFSARSESEVAEVKVTDFNEYDGIQDVMVSLSDLYAESGKSLKVSFTAVDSAAYQPGFSIATDCNATNAQGIRFSVFNPQSEPIVLSVTVENSAGKKETLSADVAYPGERREVYFALPSRFDSSSVKKVTVNATTPQDLAFFDLYIDNVALVQRGEL